MKILDKLDLRNKKIVIFDLDGTLIDSIGIWNETDYQLIKQLSHTEVELMNIQEMRDDFLERHTSNDSYLDYCCLLKKKYSIKESSEEILNLRWKISQNYLMHHIDYKQGAEKLLIALKTQGKTLVLATVTTQVQLDIYKYRNKNIINKANFLEIFDYILSKEDLIYKKPHPEIYHKVLEHYQVTPDQCIVFEDSYVGVMAAKKAGIEVVNVYDCYSDKDRKRIEGICDFKINDYGEILKNVISLNKD